MKKFRGIIILSFLLLTVGIAFLYGVYAIINSFPSSDNMHCQLRAVIVRVVDRHLLVMSLDDNELIAIGQGSEEPCPYKEGQEVLIYYNGFKTASDPLGISNIGRIDIMKEESDIVIPEGILERAYNLKY